MSYKLLTVSNDAKTKKGEQFGYLTGVCYMAPHRLGGGGTLCPHSTEGCRRVCLYTAGRGAFSTVQNARLRKAQHYLRDREGFVWDLHEDIIALCAEARQKQMTPVVRLNGTTDIPWEQFGILEDFSDVQFLDYTKWPPTTRLNLPDNYSLTFSYSEQPLAKLWSDGWYRRGVNTTAVFHGELPVSFLDKPVINGDESDLRFLDPPNVVVGLKVKGKARHDDGDGFVQRRAA